MMQNIINFSKNVLPAHKKHREMSQALHSKMKEHFRTSHRTLKEIQAQTLKGNFSQVTNLYKQHFKNQVEAFKDISQHTLKHASQVTSTLVKGEDIETFKTFPASNAASDNNKPTFFKNLLKMNKFTMALLASMATWGVSSPALSADLPLTTGQEQEVKKAPVPYAALEALNSQQIKALAELTEQYAANTKATAEIIKDINESTKPFTSGTASPSKENTSKFTQEQELMRDFLKSLGKTLTPDFVKNTFSDLSTKLHRIWQQKVQDEAEAEAGAFPKSLMDQFKDTSVKLAKTYFTLQWGMMKLSWKVGINLAVDLGPKLISLAATELMWMLPLIL